MENWQCVLKECAKTFNRLGIVYQLAGGSAARYYGSNRGVADLDFEMSDGELGCAADELVDLGAKIIRPLGPYKDFEWNLNLATLDLDGQEIDLCGSDSAMIYDSVLGEWTKLPNNPARAQNWLLDGITVRIIPREDLIRYKGIVRRAVDIEDIRQISSGTSE